ncbi:arsenic transporter [Pseudomonas amygdali]|uniref:arsenic transporter n=1 Tax=Pseudomonas amygdali TaxID=47877 RepID=UPI0005C83243|nr:arsenic transporter [Pseudomonas amygdali]PHN49701.1 arsenic transporter [Pseudomonas amygdali]
MLIATLIFLFTITLVIWQPKGLSVGWSAVLGAVLALLTGVVHLSDIAVVWGIIWNATATFISLIIITLLLDEAGFFAWAALHVARWGKGKGRRLFALFVLFGALVSALFANDGAVLILTPIVIAMMLALRFSAASTLAFVMAAGFIADTASLPLVVSNLVNIVSADYFKIGFNRYAAVMVPVNLASVAATLAVLLILLVGCFALEPLGIPISAISSVCALLLLAIAAKGHTIKTRKVMKEAPWHIVVFSLGMYLVVYGLRNAGLTGYLASLLDWFAGYGIWGAAMGTGVMTAFLSSIMNNMPTVLVGLLSIDASHASGAIQEAMIYANVIGSDLGPKITPIGSLATLLWLHVLERKGITISWGYYFKVGIVLTVPVLLITLAALALRLS